MGGKSSWHGPVCPATQPTHLRGSLAAPETISFLWAGTRIGFLFFCFFFLRNSFSIRCTGYGQGVTGTSGDKQTKTAGSQWCPQWCSVGSPVQWGPQLLAGCSSLTQNSQGACCPWHSRGCLGSLNPRASSAFCSQPSCSLSHPFSPFFFKTIVCVPPSPPPAIVFVDDLTRSHQKPHTENQQRGMGGETNYE